VPTRLNLMGYNDSIHLAKFQWDIIHNNSGEVEFDSTGQVMSSWTIIDKKHTKLFNHVYDNNLNPYKAGNGICKPEEWTEEWSYSDDKPEELVDKVINKLKDAANGKTIAKITLRDNGIYVGKHTVGNKEYPTAIYSRKKEISNIKKIMVTELKGLEADSVKKHLYCESTYKKYLVLAFYEEGENEPALMIQAAKNELELFSDKHLEAWMKYVGVMETPLNNNNFTIQLFNGERQSGRDSIMLITAEPAMPDIRAKIVSTVAGTYKMKLVVSYLRQCTGSGVGRTPNQTTSFPANGWQEANKNEEWDIDFGTDVQTQRSTIRGGIAYLIAESPSGIKDTLRFFIKGTNPSVQQLNTYLNQAPYNGIWFFKKIIFHESGSPNNLTAQARQFNPYDQNQDNLSENSWNAYSRMPTFGAHCGWGLGQLDDPAPPAQTLWDWQANIRAAYDLLNNKRGIVTNHLTSCNSIVLGWNIPGRPIVEQPDRIEGGITYTHASSPNFTHAINTHFGDQPTNNRRSFIDACWIKLYNGQGPHHYYYLVRGATRDDPPEWLICDYATWQRRNNDGTTTTMYNYYVRDIGNRNTP
jgi:hypothetical protein